MMNNILPKIRRHFVLAGITLIGATFLFSGCCRDCIDTAQDLKYLSQFHEQYFPIEVEGLESDNLALYVDYSTCIAEGQNSEFFRALVPSWVNATKQYYSIKGNDIQQETESVYQLLSSIKEVNYADLKSAIEKMATGNTESALLTDGEYFQPSIARANVNNPYMADAFKTWLLKGHDIYIISEPYVEKYKGKNYNKKRFYILFTDNRLRGNIYDRIMQTANLRSFSDVELFHLSADHPSLLAEGGQHSAVNSMMEAKVQGMGNFEIQDWQLDWEDGIEPLFVCAVDPETGEPLSNGEVISNGIKVDRNSLGGFRITDITANVYNINEMYTQYYSDKEQNIESDFSKYSLMSGENFIVLDKDEFSKHGMIALHFDTQMYNPDEFLNGDPCNYTKVDICVNSLEPIFDNFADMFKFESIDVQGEENVSMATSIQQCMANPEVQSKVMKSPIYTYYIKSFKR